MIYTAANDINKPNDEDVKRFMTCLQLADDQWPHEADEDGAYLVASDSGLIVHLSPATHGQAFAWIEVGPTVSGKYVADAMGLGCSLSESLFPALGCQFFLDQLNRPCVGYTHPLPDLGKWIDAELMEKALHVEEGYEDLFDEAIDIQIEVNDAIEHLVKTVSHFCELVSPAVGPLAAEAIPPITAAAIARDVVDRKAAGKDQGRIPDCVSEFFDIPSPLPDDGQASSYSSCQVIRLIRDRYSSFVGQAFVDGKLCRLRVSGLEDGCVMATMRLPGSKCHNQRISVVHARAHLLGKHYLENPESVWKYVSVRMDDGEVVLRKTWPLVAPSPDEIDSFARDAMGFIADYGEDMLDAGDPTRLSRLFEAHIDEGGTRTPREAGGFGLKDWMTIPHQLIAPVPSVPANIYEEDEPF